MLIQEMSSMFRIFSDSFALDNGVTPCGVAALSSQRLNNGSHPHAASSRV